MEEKENFGEQYLHMNFYNYLILFICLSHPSLNRYGSHGRVADFSP